MRHVLVTGGSGFVGRAVIATLDAAGMPLTLALRDPSSTGGPPDRFRIVPIGSIDRRTDWREALAGVDAVVHLAAHVHVAPERAVREADLFEEVNHLGTRRLFEQAAASGVRHFVFLSSITVLGIGSDTGAPFDDASEPRPATPYARSKLAAETTLADLAAGTGLRLVVLRPPLVCGPGVGGNLRSLARLAASPWPLPFGGIRNRRTLLSLDNLASALAAALAGGGSGTFCLGDARPLSTSDIVRALRDGAGRSAPLLPMPAGLLRWAAARLGRGGVAQRLLGDLEVDSRGFRRAFGWDDVIGTADALRRTGAAVRGETLPMSRDGTVPC